MQKFSFTNRKFLSIALLCVAAVCIVLTNFVSVGTIQHVALSCIVVALGIASFMVFKADTKDKRK